ncbi:hypothetical protein IQ235_18025 [Oscillatoriales cyanobacterium LEGE 11467]|uniref:Uncharacterized protein n=1 Tax=Zarconia navalis LEGE 11467 TaxID=1828826 RepID=A0A928W185_9CYAN|nr:hypothetical protein [Zarconia navalis]MBE9042662.1 hypothetical protein [Zarconia navalis LEGE 11467]
MKNNNRKIKNLKSQKHRQFRALAARSNKYLNAKIAQHGGVSLFRGNKRINTYATVANMNNVAIKGKMAQVIQATTGVKQTREAYSSKELARMEFQEMLEAQALEARNARGHAEIICTVDDVISDIDRLVKKYSAS